MTKKKFRKQLMANGVKRNRASEFADYIARMSQYSTKYKLTAESCGAVVQLNKAEPDTPAFALI